MRRVATGIEYAVTVRFREPVDLFPVVRGAPDEIYSGTAAQALPLQQTPQLRVGSVVVVGRAGEVADVVQARPVSPTEVAGRSSSSAKITSQGALLSPW